MKYIALFVLFSLLVIQSLAVVCNNEICCEAQQSPNTLDGNGYQEYKSSCATGGLNCVDNTGCQLCNKPTFGFLNIGSRPVCGRFAALSAICADENCCETNENGNPSDGNGFLEFNPSCLAGGVNCVASTGCQLCYMPVLGSTNVGSRPICRRATVNIQNFNSLLYLSVQSSSLASGANIVQRNNPLQPETRWYIVNIPLTNRVAYQNVNSGYYLSVAAASLSVGAQVIQSGNPGQPESQWTNIATTPVPWINIKDFNSAFFLSVAGGSTLVGANVVQKNNPAQPETKWKLIPI